MPSRPNSPVLVTGGAGRLGAALVRLLIERGTPVRVLDPRPSPASLAGLDVDHHVASVLDSDAVDRAVRDASVVLHCAAKIDLGPDRDGSIRAVNEGGTRVVAEACVRRSARLVHTSSHAALDRRPFDAPLDEDRPLAVNDACAYHRSKARSEQHVLHRVRRDGLDAVIVNPGTLTGPWDFEPSLFGRALIDLHAGRVPILLDAITDYADVRDVASAVLAAAERGRRGERYLLTGDVHDIRAIARTVESVTGRRMPRRALPLWVGWAALPLTTAAARIAGTEPLYSAGMLHASVSNPVVRRDKAADELDYRPRSLAESFEDAFAFYDAERMLG